VVAQLGTTGFVNAPVSHGAVALDLVEGTVELAVVLQMADLEVAIDLQLLNPRVAKMWLMLAISMLCLRRSGRSLHPQNLFGNR